MRNLNVECGKTPAEWVCAPGSNTTFGEVERAIKTCNVRLVVFGKEVVLKVQDERLPPPTAEQLASAMFGGLDGVLISEEIDHPIPKSPVCIPDFVGR